MRKKRLAHLHSFSLSPTHSTISAFLVIPNRSIKHIDLNLSACFTRILLLQVRINDDDNIIVVVLSVCVCVCLYAYPLSVSHFVVVPACLSYPFHLLLAQLARLHTLSPFLFRHLNVILRQHILLHHHHHLLKSSLSLYRCSSSRCFSNFRLNCANSPLIPVGWQTGLLVNPLVFLFVCWMMMCAVIHLLRFLLLLSAAAFSVLLHSHTYTP